MAADGPPIKRAPLANGGNAVTAPEGYAGYAPPSHSRRQCELTHVKVRPQRAPETSAGVIGLSEVLRLPQLIGRYRRDNTGAPEQLEGLRYREERKHRQQHPLASLPVFSIWASRFCVVRYRSANAAFTAACSTSIVSKHLSSRLDRSSRTAWKMNRSPKLNACPA